MICSKCCYCAVVGSKYYCSIKDEKIEGYREICSYFLPVKNCDRCKNDPVIFNAMRGLCNPCDFDYEVAKRKMTNADRIRAMTDEELARLANKIETESRAYGIKGRAAWLEWLKKECE